jgi:hypothetical protein
MSEADFPCRLLGQVGGTAITIDGMSYGAVSEWRTPIENTLANLMED